MKKKQTGASGRRGIGLRQGLIPILACFVLLSCAGAEARREREEYSRQWSAFRKLDSVDLLGDRRPETVIQRVLAEARCPYREKSIIGSTDHLQWIEEVVLQKDSRVLTLMVRDTADKWLENRTEITWTATIKIAGTNSWLAPPDPKSSAQCYRLDIHCSDPDCVEIAGQAEDLRNGRVLDRREWRKQRDGYQILLDREDLALDAFAALDVWGLKAF